MGTYKEMIRAEEETPPCTIRLIKSGNFSRAYNHSAWLFQSCVTEYRVIFYSLPESCDIVGVKPLQWLIHVLEHLRADSTEDEITALLPYNYKKSQE